MKNRYIEHTASIRFQYASQKPENKIADDRTAQEEMLQEDKAHRLVTRHWRMSIKRAAEWKDDPMPL